MDYCNQSWKDRREIVLCRTLFLYLIILFAVRLWYLVGTLSSYCWCPDATYTLKFLYQIKLIVLFFISNRFLFVCFHGHTQWHAFFANDVVCNVVCNWLTNKDWQLQMDIHSSDNKIPLRWRHNERDGVSNHQPHDCLFNHLFMRRSRKTSKLRVTGLCAGNSPVTGEFPAQRASNAENVFIWWRHHALKVLGAMTGYLRRNMKWHIS